MASQIEIYNLALSHLGIGKEVAITTERTQEAQTLNRFYATTRDAVLRAFLWPFTVKIATLGLVEEDPNDEWAYSYRYPSDCIFARRILSGIRNDHRQSRIPSKIASDASGKLIFTDAVDAQLEYSARITDPALFPPDFVLALALRLAASGAPRLTGGDPFKLGVGAMQLYRLQIDEARAMAAAEQQDEEPPESELVRSRD